MVLVVSDLDKDGLKRAVLEVTAPATRDDASGDHNHDSPPHPGYGPILAEDMEPSRACDLSITS